MRSGKSVIAAALTLVVLLGPLAALSDQIASPLERKVAPGVTVIHYAGQDLRFTTPVALRVRLDPLSPTQIRLRVSAYAGSFPQSGSAAQTQVEIFWENFGNSVYEGSVPPESDPFEGILLTESGFTEK